MLGSKQRLRYKVQVLNPNIIRVSSLTQDFRIRIQDRVNFKIRVQDKMSV